MAVNAIAPTPNMVCCLFCPDKSNAGCIVGVDVKYETLFSVGLAKYAGSGVPVTVGMEIETGWVAFLSTRSF